MKYGRVKDVCALQDGVRAVCGYRPDTTGTYRVLKNLPRPRNRAFLGHFCWFCEELGLVNYFDAAGRGVCCLRTGWGDQFTGADVM